MSKDKKLPVGFEVDVKITAEIKTQLEEKQLSCARAHIIAKQFAVPPSLIGHTVDALGIRLFKCQLGLFGFPNKKGWDGAGVTETEMPEDFAQALRSTFSVQGELTCLSLWELATEFGVPRMQAGYIAEKLDIRIIKCQLGAF